MIRAGLAGHGSTPESKALAPTPAPGTEGEEEQQLDGRE